MKFPYCPQTCFRYSSGVGEISVFLESVGVAGVVIGGGFVLWETATQAKPRVPVNPETPLQTTSTLPR